MHGGGGIPFSIRNLLLWSLGSLRYPVKNHVRIAFGLWVVHLCWNLTHLGIVISLSPSCIAHTIQSIPAARSSFFALQSVGARSGCLHPCTSLRLYKAIPLSVLTFGWELLTPSKAEVKMLERAILRIILDVPTRAPSLGIHYLLGTVPVQFLIYKKHFSFLHSLLSLPENAVPRRLFLHRFKFCPSKGFYGYTSETLSALNLPSIEELIEHLPTKEAWKALVKGSLYIEVHDLVHSASLSMMLLCFIPNAMGSHFLLLLCSLVMSLLHA